MKNKYEELFDEWMDSTDFLLIKHAKVGEDDNDVWSVLDKQGGNLGDIESDEFNSASDIFNRMGIYIMDYIINDLTEEADVYNIDLPDLVADDDGIRYEIDECSYWVWYRKHDFCRTEKEKNFIKLHEFEFKLCELIAYHANEINLNNCYYEED